MLINLNQAKEKLRRGELIAVPTDTVFGIAADMSSDEAILKLYNLKKRAMQKPMVIQLGSSNEIYDFINHIPFDLEKLIQRFWPGPLTLVMPIIEEKVPGILRAHLPTAAFRITQNKATRALAGEFGPLVITSANLSGKLELHTPSEIEESFGKNFPVLKSDEKLYSGVASTVLAYIDAIWVILRKGEVYLKDLRKILGYNPPVVNEIDFKQKSYTIESQFYLMEKEYDGSIEVVVGFEDKNYMGAKHIISIGSIKRPLKPKEAVLKVMQSVQKEHYPHIWIDLNVPKQNDLKEIAQIFERSFKRP